VFDFRFRLQAFCNPTPCAREVTFMYNTMLNFIPVSFCTAYITVTFRVRVTVRDEG